ncbi:MAG: hypothetical protein KAI66_17610 [Lentisphaeria bacterium]|nr:hypothetical protein [Lentisphaeria bacterium]
MIVSVFLISSSSSAEGQKKALKPKLTGGAKAPAATAAGKLGKTTKKPVAAAGKTKMGTVAGDKKKDAGELEALQRKGSVLRKERAEILKRITSAQVEARKKPEVMEKIKLLEERLQQKRTKASELRREAIKLRAKATALSLEARKDKRKGMRVIYEESIPEMKTLHSDEARLTKEVTEVSVKLRKHRGAASSRTPWGVARKRKYPRTLKSTPKRTVSPKPPVAPGK